MSQFYDQASLVMVPSGYKNGKVYSQKPLSTSGELSFTRASSATRVNSSGLVEKVRTNLILQSETLENASWNKGNLSVSANTIANPLNGATTADTIIEAATTGTHYLYQSPSLTGSFTYSVYAKAKERDHIVIAGSINTTNFYSALFDLTSGSVQQTANGSSTGLTASIVSVGSGWYRCSVALSSSITIPFVIWTSDGSTLSPTYYEPNYAGDGTSGVYIFGAQAETGDIATDYIATTSAAVSVGPVSGLPRLDYSGGATCPSLLLEPQRTNLITYSEQFDNAAWSKSGVTITANNVTSPDGYVNADLATATGGGELLQGVTLSTSTAYTFSFYVKKGTATDAKYRVYNFDAGVNVVAPTSYISQTNTSDWVRVSVSFTSGATGTNYGIYLLDSAYAGTMYFWGAQLEAGAYATSYIPTLSTSVTRVADACSKTGISSLIGQTAGSFYFEYTPNDVSVTTAQDYIPLAISVGGSSGNAIFFNDYNGNLDLNINVGGVSQAKIAFADLVAGVTYKIAVAYASNDLVYYVNGTQIGTDTSLSVPACDQIKVNGFTSGVHIGSVNVNQLLLFTSRLSNADLATLTA